MRDAQNTPEDARPICFLALSGINRAQTPSDADARRPPGKRLMWVSLKARHLEAVKVAQNPMIAASEESYLTYFEYNNLLYSTSIAFHSRDGRALLPGTSSAAPKYAVVQTLKTRISVHVIIPKILYLYPDF